MAQSWFVLIYEYVPDMIERRVPYREAHLALLRELHDRGEVYMAGAIGDPVNGGLIIFCGETDQAAHDFVAADPFGAAGLVVSHRIVPWSVSVS
jgi:uncharacterized protein